MRTRKQKLVSKQYQDPETRLSELEADLLRTIDFAMDLQKQLEEQGRFIRKMLHTIQKSLK